MVLDHSGLGLGNKFLENKSGRIFLRSSLLYWGRVNNNNNNYISIALLSYVQGALQSCKQHYW